MRLAEQQRGAWRMPCRGRMLTADGRAQRKPQQSSSRTHRQRNDPPGRQGDETVRIEAKRRDGAGFATRLIWVMHPPRSRNRTPCAPSRRSRSASPDRPRPEQLPPSCPCPEQARQPPAGLDDRRASGVPRQAAPGLPPPAAGSPAARDMGSGRRGRGVAAARSEGCNDLRRHRPAGLGALHAPARGWPLRRRRNDYQGDVVEEAGHVVQTKATRSAGERLEHDLHGETDECGTWAAARRHRGSQASSAGEIERFARCCGADVGARGPTTVVSRP